MLNDDSYLGSIGFHIPHRVYILQILFHRLGTEMQKKKKIHK